MKVELNRSSYDIIIGNGLLKNSGKLIEKVVPKNSKTFIITDSNVAKLYLKTLEKSLADSGFEVSSVVIPAGEKSKNFSQVEKIIGDVFKNRPERKSTLIALGGGVVGDIAGFTASILLRGVNFIQIPTSLLAMVDSSVGGKTGINLKYGKNLVGSFYQPKLVIADTDLLKTLPKREFLAGYAEVVKYGVISDKKFFEFLEKEKDFSKIKEMVEISCAAKAKIVAEDEKENGVRALLNLGHTFGHALETVFEYDGTLLHGEAVAIGMVLALQFSEYLKICPKGRAERLEKLLIAKGLKTRISELKKKISPEQLIKLMYQDKKVSTNKLVFILASDIGKSLIKKDVNENDLKKFLKGVL
jgi:3-dehydroquinate synthase